MKSSPHRGNTALGVGTAPSFSPAAQRHGDHERGRVPLLECRGVGRRAQHGDISGRLLHLPLHLAGRGHRAAADPDRPDEADSALRQHHRTVHYGHRPREHWRRRAGDITATAWDVNGASIVTGAPVNYHSSDNTGHESATWPANGHDAFFPSSTIPLTDGKR